jgi:HlyD family secretion protein
LAVLANPIVTWLQAPRSTGQTSAAAGETETKKLNAGAVACRGRIEPENGVLRVAAPHLFGRPSLMKELRVKEGDRVRSSQLLAILDGRDQLQAALDQCGAGVSVARTRLAQVKAGAKSADLSAQRAEIARLEAGLENAQAEYQRYARLRKSDDVTASELDAKQTAVITAQRLLEEEREKLKSLSEVRPTDVDVAEAELGAAIADQQRARRELESSMVYSPATGQVIKVHAHAGEATDPQGILELAETDHMYAVAEVYETDIGKVRVGQRATITSDLLAAPIEGQVERIGMQVTPSSVLPADAASFADNRMVEVRIRLDDSQKVAGFINGKVLVVIHP